MRSRTQVVHRNAAAWAVAVVFSLAAASTWAATATISAPTDTAVTTADDTTDITFSGSVSSSTTILYAAYGVFDSTGATVVESLITGGTTFSVTVTLDASEAGDAYTFNVGLSDTDGYAVATHTLTVTKEVSACDPDDFLCQAGEVFDTAEAAINTTLDDALASIEALLTVPFDQDDVDAAWAAQDAANSAADAIKDQAESDADELKDMASGQVKGPSRTSSRSGRTT